MKGFGFGDGGWYHYYGDDGESFETQIPYKIEIFYAKPGFQLVVMYESDIVEETTWGEYEVTKLVNHNPYWGDDNYVLLVSHLYTLSRRRCCDSGALNRQGSAEGKRIGACLNQTVLT